MRHICIFILLLTTFTAHAYDCFDYAGRDYHIDPDLLRAVAWKESHFRVGSVGKNTNGSVDVGLMQINSQHFQTLSKYGISKEALLKDGCLNIYTGAYFLAQAFRHWGVNWDSVGAYNAGFAKNPTQDVKRKKYAKDVHYIYMKIKAKKNTQR